MPSSISISIPQYLPTKISPCPIIEAVFEVRFASNQPWENLPGLLHAQIKGRYPEQKNLPMLQIPEDLRRQQPEMQYRPLIQFLGQDFLIQIGSHVVELVTKPHTYPGWSRIQSELEWLLDKLKAADFIQETERLGVRYIDFIDGNVFQEMNLNLQLAQQAVVEEHTEVTTILRRKRLTIRLSANNGAIVGNGDRAKRGSILDVDAWFGALDVDLFKNGMKRFTEAHQEIKSLFFGLITKDFLNRLDPKYS